MKNIFALTGVLASAAIAATLVAAPSAFADDQSNGCGVGWQVTQKTTLLGTTTRDTTNAFLPNTFSMTSGTSGCAKHPLAKKDQDALMYVMSNYDPLTIQMAEGRGEYLDGFAHSMGCDGSSREAFDHMTQKNFRAITNEGKGNAYDVFLNVKEQIRTNPVLAVTCNA